MTKEDFEAKLALKQLERRTRLIRQATLTPFGRSKVYWLLWMTGGFVAITLCLWWPGKPPRDQIGSWFCFYVIFAWLAVQTLIANGRINALVELIEVEKLWKTPPDKENS